MPAHTLSPAQPLTLAALAGLLADGEPIKFGDDVKSRFAARADRPAESPQQVGLLRAHACGTGPEVPPTLVRLMLLLTVQQADGGGPTGLAAATAERLLAFYNRELLPVVFEQGGDEAASAHLALPLLGEGEVNYQGYRLAAADALSLFSWAPLVLRNGEAGALRRGAPFTLAYAVDAALRAQRLARAVNAVRALSASAALDQADAQLADFSAVLASVAVAVDAALQHSPAALGTALAQLGSAVAAQGQASAGRTGRISGAPGAGPAARALASHSHVISQFIAAEADSYAALRARQLVETAEQLLGLELLTAAQAVEAGAAVLALGAPGGLLAAFRAAVPVSGADQAPYPALRQAAAFVRSHVWAA